MRRDEVSAGGVDYLGGVVKGGHKHIEDVAKTRSRISDAVGEAQPAFWCLDWVRTHTVLDFLDGVVDFVVDDFFFLYFGVADVVAETKSDAATAAYLDETILRAGVECIFAVNKFGMQHHIALLSRM